jgi:hypothetical protein
MLHLRCDVSVEATAMATLQVWSPYEEFAAKFLPWEAAQIVKRVAIFTAIRCAYWRVIVTDTVWDNEPVRPITTALVLPVTPSVTGADVEVL